MNTKELRRFSRQTLKGHYGAALRGSWLLRGLYVLRRAVPAGLGALLVLRGSLTAGMLWQGSTLWAVFCVLWSLFCAGMMLPVSCGVWGFYGALPGLCTRRTYFGSVREYLRGALVFAAAGALRLVSVLPAAGMAMLAVYLLRVSALHGGALRLFAAVQAMAGMLWGIYFALRCGAALSAVPFVYLENPERPVVSILQRSVRILHGHHRGLWRVRLGKAIGILLPFLLPRADCAESLFMHLRMREFDRDNF